MGNEVASLPQEKFSILFCLIIKGKIFAILCLFTILILPKHHHKTLYGIPKSSIRLDQRD
jgi:hypothetical protein